MSINRLPDVDVQHAFCNAAKNKDFDTVFLMLDTTDPSRPTRGLINAQPSGRWTVLHQAAFTEDTDTVLKLITMKADLDRTTSEGMTPLEVS